MLWGIDLGGTKIECAIIEQQQGSINVIHRKRIATEAQLGYAHIIHQVKTLIDEMKQDTGLRPDKIGMGTPGALEPATQTMKNCNTTALNGMPFEADLQQVLGIPIKIANDANCFALAEANLGAAHRIAPNAEVVFGIIMGTGVGGGIVVNGKVIHGQHGIGGEWGHNFLDESGGKCYCGRIGCVETILSGPALQRYYTQLTQQNLLLKDIVHEFEAGTNNAAAQATMQRLVHFFGKAVAPIINIIDPTAIVIGGGVGNIDLLYTQGKAEVKKYLFNPTLATHFLKPDLGDSAGVFGAALL